MVAAARRLAGWLGVLLLVGGSAWVVFVLLTRPGDEAAKVVGLVASVLGLAITLAKSLRALLGVARPGAVAAPTDADVDALARAVHTEWEAEATRRHLSSPAPIPVSWSVAGGAHGPVGAALGVAGAPRRFAPWPGAVEVTDREIAEGGGVAQLWALWGGLASGRLVVAGPPGCGKTGAGILLVLHALQQRGRLPADDAAKVPVPVLVTLAGFDPSTGPFDAWLAARVAGQYLPGAGGPARARALVADGRVAAVLDGLDEVPVEVRAPVLAALSVAGPRLLVLTRTAELAAAERTHRLLDAAVVELCPVPGAVAADYLERSLPGSGLAGWERLLATLRTGADGELARALGNPLTLTLLRDTVGAQDDVTALLAPPDDLTTRLLDRLVDRATEAGVSRQALAAVAARMSAAGTRDLAWWEIPARVPAWPRRLLTALLVSPWLLVGLLGAGAWYVILPPLLASLPVLLAVTRADRRGRAALPARRTRVGWRAVVVGRPALLAGAVSAVVGAGLVLLIAFWPGSGPMDPVRVWGSVLVGGLVFALIGGPTVGVLLAWTTHQDTPAAMSPLGLWREHARASRRTGLAVGLGTWAPFAVGWFLMGAVGGAIGVGLGVAAGLLVLGALFGLMVGVLRSRTFAVRVALAAQAVGRDGIPVRLFRLLERARDQGLVRTVGPVYQFRHAGLQDRLAGIDGQGGRRGGAGVDAAESGRVAVARSESHGSQRHRSGRHART